MGKKSRKENKQKRLEGFKQRMLNNPSPPEIEMEKILNELQTLGHIGVYEKQKIIFNRYILDFYLPDRQLCIEVDGKKWHNERKDRSRDKFLLKKAGINTVRIPAYEPLFKRGLAKKRMFEALRYAVVITKISSFEIYNFEKIEKCKTNYLPKISLFDT